MIDTCNSLSPIFLNFKTINALTIGENGVITHSSNKKLKLPFRKTKLGIQSLSNVGPNTWNSLPNNLKSATSVNSFKHYIKAYFLKKLANFESDIYIVTFKSIQKQILQLF